MKTLTAGGDVDKSFLKPVELVFRCHICVVLKAVKWCENVDFKRSWNRPIGSNHFQPPAFQLYSISSLNISCEIHISKYDLETRGLLLLFSSCYPFHWMQLSTTLFLFDYSAQHVVAVRGRYGAGSLMCDVKNQCKAKFSTLKRCYFWSDGHKYLKSSPLMTIKNKLY